MKTRLFRTVVAFLFAGLALTQVGCYDQQIDDLNNRIDELTTGKIASIESQYSSLQTTLSSLQSADAAMTTKIAALEAGSKEVADLKAAQATLQAAIDAVEAQLDGFLTKTQLDATLASYATAKDVADVVANLGKFAKEADIQAAINEAKAAAIAAAGEAMKESFQTSFDAAFAKAAAGLASTADVEAKIAAALKTADEAIAAAVKTAIEKYDGEIKAAVKEQLDAAVAELAKHISARLTSLQVIPELFVNGVETVELQSFVYTAQAITVNEAKNDETVANAKGAKEVTTSALTTTVKYYASPAQVTNDDIDAANVSFLCHKAETQTRAAADAPVQVKSASIEKGILSVELVKTASNVAVNAGQGKTWVGAVKVPIAAKHLAAGETDAAVISDYVALTETSVHPVIASVIDLNVGKEGKTAKYDCALQAHNHFSASFAAAKEANASQKAKFDGKLNLTEMVTGCADAKELTVKTLNNAGLEFKFEIPTTTYAAEPNNTDQQKFAKIVVEDGVYYAVPVLPDGTLSNEAAVGKTPIVRVTLVDTNNANAIVDVKYFKIEWTKGDPMGTEALDFTKTFAYTLSCNDFEGKILWEDMITKVLAKLNGNGMSFDEFIANYTLEVVEDEDIVNTGVARMNADEDASMDAPALVWTITAEQIGNVMDIRGNLIEAKGTKTIDLMFKANNNYTHKNYTFQLVMKVGLPYMPQIYGYESAMWEIDGELAYVFPVQYKSSFADYVTCSYNYDVDQMYIDSKIVKSLLPCGKWDIQWAAAKSQPEAIQGSFGTFNAKAVAQAEPIVEDRNDLAYVLNHKATATATTVEAAAYVTVDDNATNNWYGPADAVKGGDAAPAEVVLKLAEVETQHSKLISPEEGYWNYHNWWDANDDEWVVTKPAVYETWSTYMPTNAAKLMVGKDAVMKVWAQINAWNPYEVKKVAFHFVEPLKVNTTLTNAYFVDKVIDGSVVDCSNAFSLTDFANYVVAEEATEENPYAAKLWNYYGVEAPAWDVKNAVINVKTNAEGNNVVDETLTAETAKMKAEDYFGANCLTQSGNTLTFVNVNGVDVAKTTTIYVPVTVSHKWGKVTAKVAIEIRPADVK